MVSGSLINHTIESIRKDSVDISKVTFLNNNNAWLTKFSNFKLVKATTQEVRFDIQDPCELEFVYDAKIENEIKKSTELFNRNVNFIFWTY